MADFEQGNEDALKRAVLRAVRRSGSGGGNGRHAGGDPADAAGQSVQITPLRGGIGRRSCVASVDGASWVVRTSLSGPPGSLDIQTEGDITAQAAALGVTLPVVPCDDGLLITAYRDDAEAWTPGDARRPENITRIAAVLRRLHGIRLPGLHTFDPEGFAVEYVAALGGRQALPAAQRAFADAFAALARDHYARFPQIVLCHNDLVASNILDGGGLWLIDFEYAVRGAPVLDLAGLAAMNDYGRYERLLLSEAYYGDSPVPFSAVELDKAVRLVRLIAYFWALSSARKSAEPEPYERFAEHIEAQLA